MLGFGISVIEPSGCAAREFVMFCCVRCNKGLKMGCPVNLQ
jgi:hypothetical protein